MIKNLKRNLLALCVIAMLSGQNAMAKSPEDLEEVIPMVTMSSEGKLKVSLINPGRERLLMQIIASRNGKIYEISNHEEKFGTYLNVSELGNGDYTFRLRAGKQTLDFPFTIETTTIYKLKSKAQDKSPNNIETPVPVVPSTRS